VRLLLLAFLACALAPVGALAAPPYAPAIAAVTLEPQTATVGDRITMTVVVEHDASITIDAPGFDGDFGGLEVVEIPDRASATDSTTVKYVLAAFRTGSYTIPSLSLAYSGGGESGILRTPEQRVVIESVLRPGETELRPLKPQLEIPESPPPPYVPTAFVAIFALLTVFGYVLMRRAIAERPPAPAPGHVAPAPPAHARARAALDALAAQRIAARDAPEHYFRLAAIVRGYLSERFSFPAYAMTRSEIEDAMTNRGIDRWPARLAADLLAKCDSVEFAGFRPAPERVDADLTGAYEIIELTREPDAAPTPPGAEGIPRPDL
jgi:hypothetical protein